MSLSAFKRKTLVKEDNANTQTEIWYCPEDEKKKIVEELNIIQPSTPINLRDLVDKMRQFSFHGRTRKYFVGYCIILMKMLYTCCRIKEKTTDIKLFKSIVTQTIGIEYNETISAFREMVEIIYANENMGKMKETNTTIEMMNKEMIENMRKKQQEQTNPFPENDRMMQMDDDNQMSIPLQSNASFNKMNSLSQQVQQGKMEEAVQEIRKKFGDNAVFRASSLENRE